MEEASNNDADVFVYMGEGGPAVPHDVVRVRVHPSVTIIPPYAFQEQKKLKEVELCEGLLEIGTRAFYKCESLKRISIPSTVAVIQPYTFSRCEQLEELELCDGLQEIGNEAFFCCSLLKRLTMPNTVRSIGTLAFCHAYQLQYLQLPEGIENIGEYKFSHNRCGTCRIPPNLTRITSHFIGKCKSMVSVEFSENVIDIEEAALFESHSLRNVAFPPNAQVDHDAFMSCTDLQQLFGTTDIWDDGTDEQLINALKHRFDNLPIHKMMYYQSYNSVTVDQLNEVTGIRISRRRSKLDPTGSRQDCLGMTPLHILACSTVQNIELYKALVDKFPANLLTEDRWGAIPLLYAVWGDAPDEIVLFLVESYKSLYPDHVFNWTKMLVTISRTNTQKVIHKLLDVQEESFSTQLVDWDRVFDELIANEFSNHHTNDVTFKYLLERRFSKRISAIGVKHWRDDILDCIRTPIIRNIPEGTSKRVWVDDVTSKLASYEGCMEATAVLELALWKKKINDSASIEQGDESRCNKKPRIDESAIREQCRVNCGADTIIENVLPFLLPEPADDNCSEYDSSSDIESDDDGSESE